MIRDARGRSRWTSRTCRRTTRRSTRCCRRRRHGRRLPGREPRADGDAAAHEAGALLRPRRAGGDHPARADRRAAWCTRIFDRRAGREPVEYPHPSLEPILERTLGVPLFQEQLLRIAMVAAGFTGGEAEELRRAMGFKRSDERMNAIEAQLRDGHGGATASPARPQDQIVKSITSFALYGFPESHAASFALLAYASAYLKAHHPAAFYAALLNNRPMGFYHPATLVKDAQRHGMRVLPDRRRRARAGCAAGRSGAPCASAALRQGPAQEAGEAIERAQAKRPVRVARRISRGARSCGRESSSCSAHAGALAASADAAGGALAGREGRAPGRAAARSPTCRTDDASPLPEMSPIEETRADYGATEMTAGPAPARAPARRPAPARRDLGGGAARSCQDGERVTAAGAVIVRQRPGTAKGFVFLTLEDETGMLQAIVRPDLFKAQRAVVVGSAGARRRGPAPEAGRVDVGPGRALLDGPRVRADAEPRLPLGRPPHPNPLPPSGGEGTC